MGGPANSKVGDMFARMVVHLSGEIQRLTREIPLREGQLLELRNHPEPNEGALRRVAEQICQAREQLETAEGDLVQLEAVILQAR